MNRRKVLGLIIAPVAAPAMYALIIHVVGGWDGPEGWSVSRLVRLLLISVIIGLPFAYLATVLLGAPLFLLFRRLRWLNFGRFHLVAALQVPRLSCYFDWETGKTQSVLLRG